MSINLIPRQLVLSLFVLNMSSHVYADTLPNFFPQAVQLDVFAQQAWSAVDELELDAMHIKKDSRYVGEDELQQEQSILDNDFYQDEDFRFYNHTQYSLDSVKDNYMNSLTQTNMSDLSISLGYGMEFRVSRYQHIGYEYLSSFPYDRGQTIRIFWKARF